MAQTLELQITGLRTNPSPIGTKGGSLNIADNINIDSPNTASSRRGFKRYSTLISLGLNRFNALFSFGARLHAHYGNKLAVDLGTGIFSDYTGTYALADSAIGFRWASAIGSLYFTTSAGIKKLDGITGTPVDAGAPRGLGADITVTTATGGFLTVGTAGNTVAYRIVWGYKDGNKKIILGYPSERIEATLASGGSDSNVVFDKIYIPDGVTENYFFQIYRSYTTGSALIPPSDEMYLDYEGNPTSEEIANGYVGYTNVYTDISINTLLGATLYTSPSQEGIGQGNTQPPFAKDITTYKNLTFYGNCRTRHRIEIALIGASIGAGTTITINSETYTAMASGAVYTNGEFNIVSSGGSAENIRDTAQNLIKAINLKTTNTTLYAYYASSFNELPGKIVIERRDMSDTSFYMWTSANGDKWNPSLPTTDTNTVISSTEDKPNRVYISKYNEPDAVPLSNYLDAGTDESSIVRIQALREVLFIFKSNGEIYKIVGEDVQTFSIDLFDNTTRIYGAKTLSVFNNQCFMYSDQGIVTISDAGVQVKSWDIEDSVIRFISTTLFPDFATNACSIGYESARKYILCDGLNKMWVHNSFTNTWTNWDLLAQAMTVNQVDDKLYLAKSDGYIYQERKEYTDFDYADNEYSNLTITGAPTGLTDTVTLTGTDLSNVAIGQTLRQGDYRTALITDISTAGEVTLEKSGIWKDGACSVNDPIECRMEWLPIYTENAGMMKRFREMTVMFRDMNQNFSMEFTNNFTPSVPVTANIARSTTSAAWGALPWGTGAWGGTASTSQEHRTLFPLNLQRALWAIVTYITERAFTKFSLNAVSVVYEEMATRFNKT